MQGECAATYRNRVEEIAGRNGDGDHDDEQRSLLSIC